MREKQFFKLKTLFWITLGVVLLNSIMWYMLSSPFFNYETRLFLFIMFNEVYMLIASLYIYFSSEIIRLKDENLQLHYIVKRLDKIKSTKGVKSK